MIKEKRQYNNIDLFKIIFAVVVVMIHTKPFADISETASWYFSNTIANLAVPFFFVASGFLLFGKLINCDSDRRNEYVKKYLLHIVKMYLIWCVIWIPLKALHFYSTGTFTFINCLLYIKDVILVSGGDALWYLPALTIAVVIVYLLKYRFKMPNIAIIILSFALYTFGCLISSWYGIFTSARLIDAYYSIFTTTDNGILYGIMFVSIGMVITENKKETKPYFDILGFLIFFALLIFESNFINKSGLNFNGVCNNIMLPVTVFFMFRVILNINVKGDERIYRKLRDYSTIIYLSHCIIIRCIKLVLGIVDISLPYSLLFAVTLTLSFMFAIFVRYMNVVKKINLFMLLY